MFKIKV